MKKICIAALQLESMVDFNEKLEETCSLALACGFEIITTTFQKRRTPHPTTFFGQGKCEEISEIIQELKCEGVMIASPITPSQMKNLKDMWKCEVFDRNDCILEIFARRAQTRQAKLQVELAYLKHRLPYVIHTGQNFSRMGGSAGKSAKGEGEKQLELDKRKIETQIQNVSRELKSVLNSSEVMRRKRSRSSLKNVALVGYTNAGKSTCMNTMLEMSEVLSDKQVMAKDMLFATLDTTIRRIKWKQHEFLLSDTVGFVSDLPKELMDAFHSTLLEVIEADLILLVLDESSEQSMEQLRVTMDTLELLEVKETEIFVVHNKCDQAQFYSNTTDHFYISAATKQGMKELLDAILMEIQKDHVRLECRVPYEDSQTISLIQKKGKIESCREMDEGYYFVFEIQTSYEKYFDEFRS